jgi:uncharacterized protein
MTKMAEKKNNKSERGFASMDEEKQREIASKGGKAAHEKGTAHEFTSEEAREAGRKGGETVSQNREHMSQIGRKGGQASGGNRRRNNDDDNDHDRQNGNNE